MGEYFDLGSYSRTITTTSVEAITWFNRGLLWCYGFNQEEAARCFEKVIESDPYCATTWCMRPAKPLRKKAAKIGRRKSSETAGCIGCFGCFCCFRCFGIPVFFRFIVLALSGYLKAPHSPKPQILPAEIFSSDRVGKRRSIPIPRCLSLWP